MIKPEVGAVVGGKYELLAPVGEGGMGAVWKARHVTLGRVLAVKFVRAESNLPAQDARFLREAKAAASVRHRNVVDVSDFGTTEPGNAGLPYLVMEWLSGMSLAHRIVVGPPLSPAEIVSVAAGALDGLAAVHAAGVIHRDLKPENIFLVREEDGTSIPKLVDFGISRALPNEQERRVETRLTRTGSVIGTPWYMSPEQVRGARDLDARTDLFSMGVILYEALAGQLPFRGETVGEVMIGIATTEAPPLRAVRPEVGEDLAAVVHRALARDRDSRFPSARAMREALLGVRAGVLVGTGPRAASRAPAQATPGTPLPQTRTLREPDEPKPAGPSRFLMLGAAGVLGAAAVFALTLATLGRRSTEPSRRTLRLRIDPSPAPPAPAPIHVRLHGIPPGARIRVDGTAVQGADVELPRDTRLHEIEVTASGRAPWIRHYPATSDVDDVVELEPLAQAPPESPPTPRTATKAATRRGRHEKAPGVPAVIHDVDY